MLVLSFAAIPATAYQQRWPATFAISSSFVHSSFQQIQKWANGGRSRSKSSVSFPLLLTKNRKWNIMSSNFLSIGLLWLDFVRCTLATFIIPCIIPYIVAWEMKIDLVCDNNNNNTYSNNNYLRNERHLNHCIVHTVTVCIAHRTH